MSFRPQQGLIIMNIKSGKGWFIPESKAEFPSPTGVNHYECYIQYIHLSFDILSFRPQQGLIIMNNTIQDI